MIFPSRRSLSTSAAFASGTFRVTTGRRRPASASEIARAKFGHRRGVRAEVRLASVHQVVCRDFDRLRSGGDRDEPTSRTKQRSSQVERPFRPDEIDGDVGAGIVCEISKRGRRFGWTHCQVSAGVESRFPCLRPELDCHYAGVVCLRDLNRGQADTARPDDDDDIVLIRLSEGDNCTVRGSAAAPEGSGQG